MKIAVIGDIHISRDTIDVVRKCVDDIKLHLTVNKVDEIVITGDMFVYRKSQELDVLLAALELLSGLTSVCKILRVIPGNHDKVDGSLDVSYIDAYKHIPSLKIHDRTSVSYDMNLDVNNTISNIVFVPYFDSDRYSSEIESVMRMGLSGDSLIFTHIGINGAYLNDKSGKYESNLKPKDFKVSEGDVHVISGHFHNRCSYSDKSGVIVTYTGSLYQSNFGEDTSKGMAIIDTSKALGSKDFVTYFDTVFPIYNSRTIDISSMDESEFIEVLDYAMNEAQSDPQSFSRLIIRCMKSQSISIDTNKFLMCGIKVDIHEVDTVDTTSNGAEFKPFSHDDLLKEFELFCQSNDIDPDKGKAYLDKILIYGTKEK